MSIGEKGGGLIFSKSFCFENKVLNCKGQSGVSRIVVRIIWFDSLDQYFIFSRFTKAGKIRNEMFNSVK